MIVEIERVAALDAKEFAVDPGAVAIVAADDVVIARAERGLAAVGAMGADRAHMRHFPRPGFVPIRSARQRAHRTNIDARPALVALEAVPVVRRDLRYYAAIDYAQRGHTHAFIADAHAAITQDASRRIEKDDWRNLLLRCVHFRFGIAALADSIPEGHVLELALTTLVANRAI